MVEMSWVGPIISGLVSMLAFWGLSFFHEDKVDKIENINYLYYGKAFKFFLGFGCFSFFFLLYVFYKTHNFLGFLLVFILFFIAFLILIYNVFFVKIGYDNEFIYYKSPFLGCKVEPWSKLTKIGCSNLLQSDYMVVRDIGRIWYSYILNGYEEFNGFLENRVQELILEEWLLITLNELFESRGEFSHVAEQALNSINLDSHIVINLENEIPAKYVTNLYRFRRENNLINVNDSEYFDFSLKNIEKEGGDIYTSFINNENKIYLIFTNDDGNVVGLFSLINENF
ncbi:hypothetical protein [Acinetobacter genomosp. 15BJ]|uniref:Uncharacterized protein n=1 Tax=Acinetobacter genomosp. 15BJ TaxID=106651 RepID=R9B3U7_9GAMM|nr:hypothetical protein [Acinetobacter genomosp. 15BJ]EOR08940.1 hypothetical protein F896_01474 [Acinetobacter genomosp. 15BJ]MDO3657114.1 hypothetical protein [Acinetobacter genomosp. 15BJ]